MAITDWIRLPRFLRDHQLRTAIRLDPFNPESTTSQRSWTYRTRPTSRLHSAKERAQPFAPVTLDPLIDEVLAIADITTRDMKTAKRVLQGRKASA
jgi:hypothetical protein